jgi:hypothetical protein
MIETIAVSAETELELGLVNVVNKAIRAGVTPEALAGACCGLIEQLNTYLPISRPDIETHHGNMTLLVGRLRHLVDEYDGNACDSAREPPVNATGATGVPQK